MKPTEYFIKKLESNDALTSGDYTFKEYASELSRFQKLVCKAISQNAYHEDMRFEEAMFILESNARQKGLQNHPIVRKASLTMRRLSKEIAITMAGAAGESIVSKTLEYLDEPTAHIFSNVYVSDNSAETELDNIVLTENGIIVLEVKRAKTDVILTEDGRMLFSGTECYDKAPLADKMSLKRQLLKTHLEKALAKKNVNIPVYVDSFIVFSAPKGQFIRVDDRCHREKYCFRTSLNKRIKSYRGCTKYDPNQIAQLSTILKEMESNVKRFVSELNYDDIRRDIGEALALLQDAPTRGEQPMKETASLGNKVITVTKLFAEACQQHAKRKTSAFRYSAATVVVGALISGAVSIMNTVGRHS